MIKNVVIGKWGKSVLFDEKKWGATGGDNEAPTFFSRLAQLNPDINFYIIGGTDYNRLPEWKQQKVAPAGNIFVPYAEIPLRIEGGVPSEAIANGAEHFTKALIPYFKEKNIKVDAGVFFAGPTSRIAKINYVLKQDSTTEYAQPSFFSLRYCSPIVEFLDATGIPWINLVPDPRYYPAQIKDLQNREVAAFSQINQKVKIATFINAPNQFPRVDKEVDMVYSGLETTFLQAYEKQDFRELVPKKNINFMVVCNEGGVGRDKHGRKAGGRGPELMKYIGDMKDVDIYGEWEPVWTDSDGRFKGALPFSDLQKMLPSVKYTFCIPIKKHWATAKFWEMAHYGIIPFLHPEYDTQKNIPCPEFLRVTGPEDLKKKIEILETDKKQYLKILFELHKLLSQDLYDGTKMVQTVMKALHTHCGLDPEQYETKEYIAPKTGLDALFDD